MKKTIILLLLLNTTFLSSQERIDSLLQIVETTSNDSLKFDTYIQLVYEYHRNDNNTSLDYANKAEQFALENGLEEELGRAKFRKGIAYISLGDFTNAEKNLNEADAIFLRIKNEERLVSVRLEIAYLLQKQSRFEDAMKLYLETLPIIQKVGDDNSEARVHNYLGTLYKDLKQPKEGIEHFKKALQIVEDLNFKPGISACISNLGFTYYEINEFDTAITYLDQALELKEELNDKLGASRVLMSLGHIEVQKKNFVNADKMYLKAMEYALLVDSQELVLMINNGLSISALDQGKYAECIEISNKILNDSSTSQSLLIMSETNRVISKAYKELGDFESAYRYSIAYKELSDSLYNSDILSVTNELGAKYENSEKSKRIELLESENRLSEEQKKNQNIILLSSLALSIVVGLFFFFQFQRRKKLNEKLHELNTAKSNFFANISHEFRTPLTLIAGPLEKKLEDSDLTVEERKKFEMMHRNSNRLISLVDQILDISKIESESMRLKVSKNELVLFVQTLVESFEFLAIENKITFVTTITKDSAKAWCDKEVVEKIITNLLSNAIKYTPEGGKIECTSFIENNEFHFEISNTGEGLSTDQINRIFERYYQVNEDKVGVGIGLALVKELVVLHKGTIQVQSTPKETTCFTVVLPIDYDSFNTNQITSSEAESSNVEPKEYLTSIKSNTTGKSFIPNEDSSVLLIIDDNADIRSYVSEIFKSDYTVIEAENGEEGVSLALEYIPDIIISDVMMPVMDGIELSKFLKNDERSCHIPIILLTAKVGVENELVGIETGADDYITKPFSEELLKLKVKKRIENQKTLQDRFSQEIILKPNNISVNTTEELFLRKIQDVLDNNLIDSAFTIQEFSKNVGMSRMQLHRKLKALTGLSTSEFIRTERLKLAAQELAKGDRNISQIGYSVGFNDHAYFSKSFKEKYNCTPSEYSNKSD